MTITVPQVHSEELATALRLSPSPVAVFSGPDWRLDYANTAYLAGTGCELGAISRDICPVSQPLLEKAWRTGEPQFLRECSYVTADGERLIFDMEFYPLPPGPGGEPRVIEVAHDVTERAQNALLLDAIMTHVPSGLTVALGPEVEIVRVADYGARLLERPRDELEGIEVPAHSEAYRVYSSDTGPLVAPEDLPLTRAARQGEVVKDELFYVANAAGERIPILCNAGPIRDREGHLIGGVIAWHDMRPQVRLTQRLRNLLAEKETLLAELTHRVKNTLQLISSMLKLQASRAMSAETRDQLEAAEARVIAMAHVHNQLYARPEVDGQADVGAALEQLVRSVRPTLPANVELKASVEPVLLPLDKATPFILLANELLTNAVKHAFPGGRVGAIQVALRNDMAGEIVELCVSDDGVGMPGKVKTGFGSRILAALGAQLGANIAFSQANGTTACVRLPTSRNGLSNGPA
jgi:two-component sensor histidine kinase